MILNKNQERLLVEISKRNTNSITSLGKKVSNTYMSTYYNIQELTMYGYVDLRKRKNKILVNLTPLGKSFVEIIIQKNLYLTRE